MKNKLSLGTLYYFLNSAIVAILSISTTKVIGLYVLPEIFGLYSLYLGIFNLMLLFILGASTQSIIRLYAEYANKNLIRKFLATNLTIFIIVCIILLVTFFVYLNYKSVGRNSDGIDMQILKLFCIMFVVQGFYQLTLSYLRASEQPLHYLMVNFSTNLLKLALLILTFWIWEKSIIALLISALIAYLLIDIYLIRKWAISGRWWEGFDLQIAKQIYWFGGPLVFLPLFNWILSSSDQLIIFHYIGSDAVGIFSMGYRVASGTFILFTSFLIISFYPKIITLYETRGANAVSKLMQDLSVVYFLIIIPVFAFICVNSGELMVVFSSNIFLESAPIYVISSIGIILSGYISYTNKPWELEKNTKVILTLTILGAIVNFASNMYFIPKFGYQAAAWTTVTSYLFVVFTAIWLQRKKYRCLPSKYTILKLTIFLFYCFVLFFVVEMYTNNNLWINMLLSIIMTLLSLFVSWRKTVITLFTKYDISN